MKKDFDIPKVENVAFAITHELIENEPAYYVYLLNLRDDIMEGIMITCQGYGKDEQTGETIRTSLIRRSLEVLLPNEVAKIEPIMPEVFGLTNEYFISFWVEDTMYDKKFLFLPDSINEKNMVFIEQLGKKGVMIK
ncbi:MAG TPA: hypothetical protein PLP27_00255 [Crocinitomicaceae bacterium]|nr:hypothetical protein [Crocinitomicaceae bacterium]